jgi:hypothetical protein
MWSKLTADGGVNGSESARIWRATVKGAPKCSREKERMREDEERPNTFVHESMSHDKLVGMTGQAPSFGMIRDTWWLLHELFWSCHLLWCD